MISCNLLVGNPDPRIRDCLRMAQMQQERQSSLLLRSRSGSPVLIRGDRSGVPEVGVPISGPAGLAIITEALRIGSSNLRESDYCGFTDAVFRADGAAFSGYFRRSGVNMLALRMTGGGDPHTLLGNVKS